MDANQDVESLQEHTRTGQEKLKGFFSGFLALIIVLCIPIAVLFIATNINYDFDLTIRQRALEENWESYLNTRRDAGFQINLSQFELTLCPFADNGIWDQEISPEEAGLICGVVKVPLFHEDPQGEIIRIPVAIWPFSGTPPNAYPLFVSQGGPGGSTLEVYPQILYSNPIREKRDIVFVDQRGTRYAEPSLVCPDNTKTLYGAVLQDENEVYDYLENLKYCRARLSGKGLDLSAFTTPQIAGDFDAVRRVFDYEKIDFYGVSYGTHIGQYLAVLYPDSVKSLILDGLAPLPLDYLNRSFSSHSRVLEEFISNCDEDLSCSAKYPNLLDKFNSTLDRLERESQKITLQFPGTLYSYDFDLTAEIYYRFVLRIFYWDHSYSVLPYVIHQSYENQFDYVIAVFESDMVNYENASGLFYSVVCAEHTTLAEPDNDDNYLIPAIGRWENNILEESREECAIWNVPRPSGILSEMTVSGIPTLLLSGQFDPITPPEYGEIVLEYFPNAQHIVDPIGPHGFAFRDQCTDNILADFMKNPMGEIDQDCLFDPARRSQTVPPSAFSSPFLSSDLLLSGMIILPAAMLLLLILRGTGKGLGLVWKKSYGKRVERSASEKRVRRRFELASWVFLLCNLGLGISLDRIATDLYDLPSYWYALALPEEVYLVLFIPLVLLLILPVVVISMIQVWKNDRLVFARVHYLLMTFYCGGIVVYLASEGLLLSWVR